MAGINSGTRGFLIWVPEFIPVSLSPLILVDIGTKILIFWPLFYADNYFLHLPRVRFSLFFSTVFAPIPLTFTKSSIDLKHPFVSL